ncbi:unnamed protein product [Amaranthus hypochondriacus]
MIKSSNSIVTDVSLNTLFKVVLQPSVLDPHPGLIIATHNFNTYISIDEIDLLSLATMDLLNIFAYPSVSGYAKFTVSLKLLLPFGEEVSFTAGCAIPLTYHDGTLIPKNQIYSYLKNLYHRNAEQYNGSRIVSLIIRIYMELDKKLERTELSVDDRKRLLHSLKEVCDTEPISSSRKIKYKYKKEKHKHPGYITSLKRESKGMKPFMVSDLETLMIENEHRPYAAGLMLVHPGQDIKSSLIYTYFSEDYSLFINSFEERSKKVLFDLVLKIQAIVKKEKEAKTVYFHNFSRFDGIILLKHLACYHNFMLKPLLRNNRLYEIAVYSNKGQLLFRIRDSLNLLPGKLSSLAMSLCPSLGTKGSIDYDNVTLSNLESEKVNLIEYMKQDILLLGGIMQKAQDIYYQLFQMDIVSRITLSSLALSIFRLKYYDDMNWPINIPNMNQDSFIRKGYYGGHTDSYIPLGENLYYYDVNSLYPYVMKEFQMPGGVPVWHGNLENKDLDSIFGFIEAYVECPITIKRPFLPYRTKDNTLIFPTGEFIGVYYSEELKLARDIGYTVIPLSGYLYEKMDSPFNNFVSTLYSSRIEAKKAGNEALSYVYKILMNSLYGRFGINPKSTTAEICDHDRYITLFKMDSFIHGDKLSNNKYIVSYHVNTGNTPESWNPPKNGAVQLAAAITACARIHMYKHISRDDCYYTDTDSVVLGNPLHDSLISSSVLGMFKLEDKIRKGYFLAPKAYFYISMDDHKVLKYKGAAKNLIKPEWFESQYADPSRKEEVKLTNNFRINWNELTIKKTVTSYRIGLSIGTKRKEVYTNNHWTHTDPIHIIDMSKIGPQYVKIIISYLRNEVNHTNSIILRDKIEQIERYKIEKEREIDEMKRKIEDLTKDKHILDTDKEDMKINPND